MLTDVADLIATATRVYGEAELSKPFKLLRAIRHVRAGRDASILARRLDLQRTEFCKSPARQIPLGLFLRWTSEPLVMAICYENRGAVLGRCSSER